MLKAKILKGKYEAKLEFLSREGVENRKPSVGGGGGAYGYFLELHNDVNNKLLNTQLVNSKLLHYLRYQVSPTHTQI